jgi:hypothetical protein
MRKSPSAAAGANGSGQGAGSFSGRRYGDYRRLPDHEDTGFNKSQFIDPNRASRAARVPWRAITLATILTVMGSLMISIGCLLVLGVLDEKVRLRGQGR